jgi:hypothetical protein
MLKEILIRNSLMSLVKAHESLKDYQLCLAVWFNKSGSAVALNPTLGLPIANADEAYLLEVAPEFGFLKMTHAQANSYGLGHIKKLHHWMVSPEKLEEVLASDCKDIPELKEALKRGDYETLSIYPAGLTYRANNTFGQDFRLPDNAVEGWYLPVADFEKYKNTKQSPILNASASLAVLLLEESADFTHRKGIMLSRGYTGSWMPNTNDGMIQFSWYNDWKSEKPGFIVLKGGRAYSILGFESISKPSVSKTIRYPNADDIYVQVLLRVV